MGPNVGCPNMKVSIRLCADEIAVEIFIAHAEESHTLYNNGRQISQFGASFGTFKVFRDQTIWVTIGSATS